MQDGKYTYYGIQHRRTHQTQWGVPQEPLEEIEEKGDWYWSGGLFLPAMRPYAGRGCSRRPVDQQAVDEMHAVQVLADGSGWWHRKYAKAALKRLRKRDARGEYGIRGRYGKLLQDVRHEFRIVKVKARQKTEVLK